MNKITKEVIKKIKKGSHDDLIDAIEFLIDTYNEDKFEAGYISRIQDEAVISHRLAEHISKNVVFITGGTKTPMKVDVNIDDLAKVIESYYSETLKD